MGHIRAHGGSNPVVPSSGAPMRTQLRDARARHCLLWGRRSCGSLSASRTGDAQTAAKHGQQAK
eukprot:792451-Prymnesium_polylepis.1